MRFIPTLTQLAPAWWHHPSSGGRGLPLGNQMQVDAQAPQLVLQALR